MAEAVLGQKGTGLGHSYNLYAYGEQRGRDTANNRSKIYVEAKLTSGRTNWSSGYASYIRVYWHDNRENYDRLCFETAISSCAYNSSYYASGEIWVTHNDDGGLSGYVYATFTKGGTSSYAPSTGGVTTDWTALWTVPRASTPSIPNGAANIGDSVTISTNRASSSFTHTLSYKFGTATGQIATGVGTSTTWAIPDNLAKQIPNATEGTCTITCVTYNGGTNIGTKTYNCKLKIKDTVKPTVSGNVTVTEGNTNLNSLNLGVYLTNKSIINVTFAGAGIYDSTITKFCVQINDGETITADSIVNLNELIKSVPVIDGTNVIKAWVIDSRQISSDQKTANIIGRLYVPPIISSFISARCNESKKDDDENVYGKISVVGSITDIKGSDGTTSKNTMYCKYRYKDSNSSDWSNLIDVNVSGFNIDFTGDNSILISNSDGQSVEFLTSTKYDIELYLYDTIMLKDSGWSGSGEPEEDQLLKLLKRAGNLLTGFDLMHFNSSGKAIALGKKSEATGYALLTSKPSKWDSEYKNYFRKVGNHYNQITDSTAPTWATNTFYEREDYKWFEVRMDQIKFEGAIYLDNVKLLWYEEE